MTNLVAAALLASSAYLPGGALDTFHGGGATHLAQGQCVNVVAYVAPSPLRCQRVGTDHIGRPIWLCC